MGFRRKQERDAERDVAISDRRKMGEEHVPGYCRNEVHKGYTEGDTVECTECDWKGPSQKAYKDGKLYCPQCNTLVHKKCEWIEGKCKTKGDLKCLTCKHNKYEPQH